MTALLETRALTRRYAGLLAVDGVDMAVAPGTIHALIGPNGAGKTTLFNLVSGLETPTEGTVLFAGADVTPLSADRRAALGLARTFQNIRVFAAMTSLENALAGLHAHRRAGLAATVLRTPAFRREERAAVERARAVLDMVGLAAHADAPAGGLSYGDQRRLEIARALATDPKLLALDEPAAGMNATETAGLRTIIEGIRADGITVLLIEHDVKLIMGLCDRVAVLDYGKKIAEGVPQEVRRNPAVIAAYLGGEVLSPSPTGGGVGVGELP
jgi:branched-chain amino acid transport system ATP-binding protein